MLLSLSNALLATRCLSYILLICSRLLNFQILLFLTSHEAQIERKEISKAIQKLFRRLSRKYQTDKYSEILEDFKDLGRLPDIHRHPIKKLLDTAQIDNATFAEVLEKVYDDTDGIIEMDVHEVENIEDFTPKEFQEALKKMRK